MLVLTRKVNETIHIGDDIKITVVKMDGNQVRLGIDAPKEKGILRSELLADNHALKDLPKPAK